MKRTLAFLLELVLRGLSMLRNCPCGVEGYVKCSNSPPPSRLSYKGNAGGGFRLLNPAATKKEFRTRDWCWEKWVFGFRKPGQDGDFTAMRRDEPGCRGEAH